MKYLFTCMLAAVAFTAMSQQKVKNQFVLNGTIQGQGWMYFTYIRANGEYLTDSTVITNGRFSFKDNLSAPTRGFLHLKENKYPGIKNPSAITFIEPGTMTISLQAGQFNKAKITGSKVQADYDILQAQMNKIEE